MSSLRKLSELRYGSFLAYTPRSSDVNVQVACRAVVYAVKNFRTLQNGKSVVDKLVESMKEKIMEMPFKDFFSSAALVPVPSSKPMLRDALWVPREICKSLQSQGLGVTCEILQRTKRVPQSSLSKPEDRPKPTEHYESLQCKKLRLKDYTKILLVDDVITRGHTFLGAAWRVAEKYPNYEILAFALIRTVSNPSEFTKIFDPRVGTITYRPESNDAIRRP